jgi:hypothetical protein
MMDYFILNLQIQLSFNMRRQKQRSKTFNFILEQILLYKDKTNEKKNHSQRCNLGMIYNLGALSILKKVPIDQLATFETGVRYQMYMLCFTFIGNYDAFWPKKTKAIYFSASGALFSGSIYLWLPTTSLLSILKLSDL